MVSRHLLLILLAGVVCGLTATLDHAGALFIYLPCLPLLLVGLSQGAVSILFAGLAACVTAAGLGGLADALFLAVIIVLPSYYFTHHVLQWREDAASGRQWYPVLRVLASLTIVTAVVFMAGSMLAASGGQSLQQLAAKELASSVEAADPQIAPLMKRLAGEWSFIVFAATGWLWVLMLYGFAVLANALLHAREATLRHSLALEPCHLSPWLLGLLALSALIAAFGQGNDRFAAEAVFLLLLLPYFLAGLAQLHAMSRPWSGRGLWLTLFYVLLIVSVWPGLFAVGMGLYSQLAQLLDKKHGMG